MLPRRNILIGIAAVGVVGFAIVDEKDLFYSAITEDFPGGALTVQDAHTQAVAGSIILVDIRRPDEWAQTGWGEGAHRIDLRSDDFLQAVIHLAKGDLDAPIALICARGVRSARESNRLLAAGFTNIIDVPEGMLGSAAGPGWIAAGLPIIKDN